MLMDSAAALLEMVGACNSRLRVQRATRTKYIQCAQCFC
jgi:hypothetical protein